MISYTEVFNHFFPTILIAWVGNNYYQLLLPINLNLNKYPIEYKI